MRSAIRALLGTFGLAPARQADQAATGLRRAETRIGDLEERLVQGRADAENWKRRYEEASDTVAGWRQAATRAQAELDRLKPLIDKAKHDLERAREAAERDEARVAEWKSLAQTARGRLDEARRAAESSSEQLVAMEAKLDLIEAAIEVLDTRTRAHTVPQ